MLGTSFTFSSTTNYPDLEAIWYLNGEKIPIYKTMVEYNRAYQREKFPFVAVKSKGNNHTLKCDEAIERFAGRYTVEVTNEEGDQTAKSEADLKVLYEPPIFLKNLEDIHVDEGKKVSFDCRIDDPNQEVVWYFRVIKIDTIIFLTFFYLRIQAIESPLSIHVTRHQASLSTMMAKADIRCVSLPRSF